MNQRQILPILLLFLLLPCKVELFLFPFDELFGLILYIVWGSSAPYPEIIEINPMIPMTTGEIIQYYGYRYERHEVVTEDGYILELHRILKNGTATNALLKTPIVFVPGLLADSTSLIEINETHSPGFFFANAGHDVWLHNNRGTRYSRKHTTLNPDTQQKYWNFSFHEMGVYDLPAVVDYVLLKSDKPQVYLAGLSMGGTAISIFLSEKPSYANKVKEAFMWAPAIHLTRTMFYIGRMGALQICNILLYLFGEMEFLPYTNNTMLLFAHLCSESPHKTVCRIVMFVITLSIPVTFSEERKKGSLAFLVAHVGGSSVKTLRHFIQLVARGVFSKYDYGPKGNLIAYNQTTAPPYVLQNIKQPINIYYASLDLVINKVDVEEISASFTNLKTLAKVPSITFNHVDFVLSPNAKKLLYEPMLREMSNTATVINQSMITPNSNHPIDDLNNSDYSYAGYLMIIFILLIIFLFVKFIHQQLSETKLKRSQTMESLEA